MTHPQTIAKKWGNIFGSRKLDTIGQYGCCAFCALWLVNPYMPDETAITTVAEHIGDGLGCDCTVYWHEFIKAVTGFDSSVKFIDIDGIQDIKHSAVPLITRFDYKGKSHWVVVREGKVVFDPLASSNCVQHGNAKAARLVEIDRK